MKRLSKGELAKIIAGVWEIRKVPDKVTNEEIEHLPPKNRPFLYASGNWGPGYDMVKALPSRKEVIETIGDELAHKVAEKNHDLNSVFGNVTGGVIPGWVLSNKLEKLLGPPVNYSYVGGSRTGASEADIITLDKQILNRVIRELHEAIAGKVNFDFIAGMTPSGMVPGYELSKLFGVPFVYVREVRKKGGQKEMITGIDGNPYIKPGDTALVFGQTQNLFATSQIGCKFLQEAGFKTVSAVEAWAELSIACPVIMKKLEITGSAYSKLGFGAFHLEKIGVDVEELVNFAQTTCNSTQVLRNAGYKINLAACILFYGNPLAVKMLEENGIEMVYLLTLPELLDEIESQGIYPQDYISDYRDFLAHPLDWQEARGLKPDKRGGTL